MDALVLLKNTHTSEPLNVFPQDEGQTAHLLQTGEQGSPELTGRWLSKLVD